MSIQSFEEIVARQKAQDLADAIFTSLKDLKDYSFKDQIRRATVSVSNNIAEGFERKTNKEFIQFLYIAKGSCDEVRSMFYLAKKRKYFDENEFKTIMNLSHDVSRLIGGFISSLK